MLPEKAFLLRYVLLYLLVARWRRRSETKEEEEEGMFAVLFVDMGAARVLEVDVVPRDDGSAVVRPRGGGG